MKKSDEQTWMNGHDKIEVGRGQKASSARAALF
jgi:hypothetical protein